MNAENRTRLVHGAGGRREEAPPSLARGARIGRAVVPVALALAVLGLLAAGCGEGVPGAASEQASDQATDGDLARATFALGTQPDGIVLSPDGMSTIGWPFVDGTGWSDGWHLSGNGVGDGDHLGDDYYADDWNWGTGNADIGKTMLAAIDGVVIFAGEGDEDGYGKQVVIQSADGDFALRYTHMNRVDVAVGDTVQHGTQIGTCGCTGLTCAAPTTAHLHLVLYRNIHDDSDRYHEPAIDVLKRGDNPAWLSGGPSHFAAPFTVDETNRVDFTREDAAWRLSPVLRAVDLPDDLLTGRQYEVTWRIMGYHGPMASSMRIQCEGRTIVRVADEDPVDVGQGWHWAHAYSRVYEFSRSFRMPADLPSDLTSRDCEVRFFWRRIAWFDQEPYDDYNAVYVSVLIPGGVDARTMGTAGRQIERTVHLSPTTATGGGTIEALDQVDDQPSLEEASRRLSPVMRVIDLDDDLDAGDTYHVTWELMSYHGPTNSMVQLDCGGEVVKRTDTSPEDIGTGWRWGDVYSTRYRFETDLPVPDVTPRTCTVRFFWSRRGYQDHNKTYLSVLIPGGVDPRPQGDAGRVILRSVR